jgi:hypothetical protein
MRFLLGDRLATSAAGERTEEVTGSIPVGFALGVEDDSA